MRLKIGLTQWGNYKAYKGGRIFAEAMHIWDLAGILIDKLTLDESRTVEFYGDYAVECRKHFDDFRKTYYGE